MAGFPIAWEETQSLDYISDTPPYSLAEIESYLFNNHYHWALKELPTTFDVSGPHAKKDGVERRFWLFEAHDKTQQRLWFVVVGTGKSPFDPKKPMKRWMYARTNHGCLSAEEFLDDEYREQLAADARFNS